MERDARRAIRLCFFVRTFFRFRKSTLFSIWANLPKKPRTEDGSAFGSSIKQLPHRYPISHVYQLVITISV